MEARGAALYPGKRQYASTYCSHQDVAFLPCCVTLCVIYVMHIFAAEASKRREWASKYHMPCIRLTLHYIRPCLFTLVVVYQPTMSLPVAIEWPVPKSETIPWPVKVSNPFCFEDPQVVLQASHIPSSLTSDRSILLTLFLSADRGTEVQNSSLLPDSGV